LTSDFVSVEGLSVEFASLPAGGAAGVAFSGFVDVSFGDEPSDFANLLKDILFSLSLKQKLYPALLVNGK
jgi:hypothetical protein